MPTIEVIWWLDAPKLNVKQNNNVGVGIQNQNISMVNDEVAKT